MKNCLCRFPKEYPLSRACNAHHMHDGQATQWNATALGGHCQVKFIAEQHSSDVTVKSESGIGSCFINQQ